MGKHNELGKKGEEIAAEYFKNNGYDILERNWRYGRAELDIIALKGRTMVFVEVKTRSDDFHDRPENAVTIKKQKLITHAAIGYLHLKQHETSIRFDVISVILRGDKQPHIDHFEDAFFPGLEIPNNLFKIK
jgi:putative endonuclease